MIYILWNLQCETLTKCYAYISYIWSSSVLTVLLYFVLANVFYIVAYVSSIQTTNQWLHDVYCKLWCGELKNIMCPLGPFSLAQSHIHYPLLPHAHAQGVRNQFVRICLSSSSVVTPKIAGLAGKSRHFRDS